MCKAGDAVAALKASLKPKATVSRDGKWSQIDAGELVPGDLVLLGAGSAVPADCLVSHPLPLSGATCLRVAPPFLGGPRRHGCPCSAVSFGALRYCYCREHAQSFPPCFPLPPHHVLSPPPPPSPALQINDGTIDVDQSGLTGESLPVTMYRGDSCKMGSTVTRGEVEGTVEVRGTCACTYLRLLTHQHCTG